ncbi:hypothetical protein M409DRAFT_61693 [Zasmidium cellare ATCC 36951]|uniref:Uncharacterized protein n=1 Tax=Zasmidium cellare ATCC 36951 TaxID=1080233 RepID=A0A6A6BXX3_ZASCE|nr:uncharacterized protein M409DRAFT_61693 [Zasmidium cellare ATCC 36951]KAF2158402.1 hypothetical protein M409DRAFT_61693 [Zasmidium cellare ATCC 36951]
MERLSLISGASSKSAHFRTRYPTPGMTTYKDRMPKFVSKKRNLTKNTRRPDGCKRREELLQALSTAKEATICATKGSRLLEAVKKQMNILEERRMFCVDAQHKWLREDRGQYFPTKRRECRIGEELNTIEDLLERLGTVMGTCEGVVCACQLVTKTAGDKIRRAKSDADTRDVNVALHNHIEMYSEAGSIDPGFSFRVKTLLLGGSEPNSHSRQYLTLISLDFAQFQSKTFNLNGKIHGATLVLCDSAYVA